MKIHAFVLAASLLSGDAALGQSDYVFSLSTKRSPPSTVSAAEEVRRSGSNNPKSDISAQRPDAPILEPSRQTSQASTGGVQHSADSEVATNSERLFLICVGTGHANKLRSIYSDSSFSYIESVPFEEQVNVEITSSEASIRMPRAMLPFIRRDSNGWVKIRDVKWSDREIIGHMVVNFFNNPKLMIDRLTGVMSINGKAGDFSAQCVAVDPDKIKRKF